MHFLQCNFIVKDKSSEEEIVKLKKKIDKLSTMKEEKPKEDVKEKERIENERLKATEKNHGIQSHLYP